MQSQHINYHLSAQNIEAINEAILTLRAELPFLVGLTPAQRQQIPKVGRKSQAFVDQALDIAATHGDCMPRNLDIDAARRDMELLRDLHPVLRNLSQICRLIEDTQMLAGSEAYSAALTVYRSLKHNGRGQGLDDAIEALALRFNSQGPRSDAA